MDNISSVVDTLVNCSEKIQQFRRETSKNVFNAAASFRHSDAPMDLDNELAVCLDAINLYHSQIDDLLRQNQGEIMVPLLPKVIPSALFEGFSYCNNKQRHLNEADIESYGDILLELYTKTSEIFSIFCKTVNAYVIEGNPGRLAYCEDLLDSISKFAVPLTELDLTSGLMAWDLFLSLYESKKESWYEDWRPGEVWRHIVALATTLLEKVFREADLLDPDEENQKEIAMCIKVLKAVIRIFVTIENGVSAPFSASEVELVVSLLATLQRYSPVILKMNDVPDKVTEFFDRKVFIACSSIIDPIGQLPETLEAIRGAVGNGLSAGEFFPCLLLSLYLLEPRNSGMVEDKLHLIQSVLEILDFCNSELTLGGPVQGIQLAGQPVPFLPVYEVVVTKIQAFVTTLLEDEVEPVVAMMLRATQKPGWAALAASDILVFMARYGSDSFCLDLFLLSEELLAKSSQLTIPLSPRDQFLESLAVRLGRMLASHDVTKIKSSVYLPLLDVSDDVLDMLIGSLLPVTEWTSDRLEKFVASCKRVMFNGKVFPRSSVQKLALTLIESIQMLTSAYRDVSEDEGTRYLIVIVLSSVLRAVSALDIEFLDSSSQVKTCVWDDTCLEKEELIAELQQVLEKVLGVINLENAELDSVVMDFISSWFQPEVNQQSIMDLYTQIFQRLFKTYTRGASSQPGLLAKLLKCFTDYAESTRNEIVVQRSVVDSVPELLASFLNIDVKVFNRKEFVDNLKSGIEVKPRVLKFATSPMHSPAVKRAKVETGDSEKALESCVEKIEKEVEKWKAIDCDLSPSLKGRIKRLISSLNSFVAK